MTDAVGTAAPNGGGVKKKRSRKRGGGGAGGLKLGISSNSAKAASGRGGGGGATGASSSARGRGSGSESKRRGGTIGGGGRGSGGGGGGNLSSRFKANAPSPLQLPCIKVTIRNIGDGSKHSSIEGIATSVRKFLEGTFPSAVPVVGSGCGNNDSITAYTMACQLEREEFEADKNMVSEATAAEGAAATFSSQYFSSGWVNDDKSREPVLPSPEDVVDNLMNNTTDKLVAGGRSIGWIVDTAMSQMMLECGEQYLTYVGGRLVLEEESFVEVGLAEKVQAERKRLAVVMKNEVDESNGADASDTHAPGGKPLNSSEGYVEDITKGIETMSTVDISNLPKLRDEQLLNESPAVRIRIVSITPVKMSKRRGEIGGTVHIVLYPPDPCILFKEKCRDAGKLAADRHLSKVNSAEEQVVADTSLDGTESGVTNSKIQDGIPLSDSKDVPNKSNDLPPKTREDIQSNQLSISSKRMKTPQIPYYPILSSMERSRALARSRVLMNRFIKAMQCHAANAKLDWEINESVSQKTWKERPHYFVRATMDGTPLSDLVAEHDSATSTAAKKGHSMGGIDSRADRLESTIESSDDYKTFLASLENGDNPSISGRDGVSTRQIADAKDAFALSDKQVDGDGRPLAAIVLHLREKQEVEKAKVEKAKAEIVANLAKARAAAAVAKEKARQGNNKVQKETSRKQREEVGRKKKQSSRVSAGRSGGSSGGERSKKVGMSVPVPMPPPGAMLLKKVGGSCPIPPSGFG